LSALRVGQYGKLWTVECVGYVEEDSKPANIENGPGGRKTDVVIQEPHKPNYADVARKLVDRRPLRDECRAANASVTFKK
jgi:hypothetical protein